MEQDQQQQNAANTQSEKRTHGFFKSLPVIGPVLRFPQAVRDALTGIPVIGPYGFRPMFAVFNAYKNYVFKYPKFFVTHVAAPLAVAGVVSAGLTANPDWTSEPLRDYAARNGLNADLFDGLEHKDIRVYTGNRALAAFHAAGYRTGQFNEMIAAEGAGPVLQGMADMVIYPPMLLTSFAMMSIDHNAFTIPVADTGQTCYITTPHAEPLSMVAALSGIPESALNKDKIGDAKWMDTYVLLHEARHCDNSKAIVGVLRDMMKKVADSVSAEEGDVKAEVQTDVSSLQDKISALVRRGETDSDLYALSELSAEFNEINDITRYSRAISVFAGGLSSDTGHATAFGIDADLKDGTVTDYADIGESLEVARLMTMLGKSLNLPRPATGLDETIQNYWIAKKVVIPYLEQNQAQTFPRGERAVGFDMALRQTRLFVEGMEFLVKPELLQKDVTAANTLPDLRLPAQQAPAPQF